MGIDFRPSSSGSALMVPADLSILSYPAGLDLMNFLYVGKNNDALIAAEFRAVRYAYGARVPNTVDLRTPAEGGTFVHNGTTQLIITGIGVNNFGSFYHFTSTAAGIWFVAWRVANTIGWSNWTDGNVNPSEVSHIVDTSNTALVSANPADTWEISVQAALNANKCFVKVTRPLNYGARIKRITFQIMDSLTGTWRALDANAGEAVTEYDGSAVDHTYDPLAGTITKAAGNYGNAAVNGGWLMADVRGSAFGHNYCQIVKIDPDQCSGATISGVFGIVPKYAAVGGQWLDIRIKVVKPPSEWNANGYNGPDGIKTLDLTGFLEGADSGSTSFQSPEFDIPAGVNLEDLEARVFFENDYCESDDDNYTTAPGSVYDIPNVNELPLGDYSNFLNPIYWERHPDSWYNIEPQADRLIVAAKGSNVAMGHYPMAGMMFRGRVFPDAAGRLSVQCVIRNLNIGDNLGGGTPIMAGFFIMNYGGFIGTNYRLKAWGMGQGAAWNTYCIGNNFQEVDYNTALNFSPGPYVVVSWVRLRQFVQAGDPNATLHPMVEGISIDGAAEIYPALGLARYMPHGGLLGLRVGVGICGHDDVHNFYAEITNFEFTEGIVVPDCCGGGITVVQPPPAAPPSPHSNIEIYPVHIP